MIWLKIIGFATIPGIIYVLFMALLVDFVDRKIYARCQSRRGPPLLQPLWDVLKLLSKDSIKPDGVNSFWFTALPTLFLGAVLLDLLVLPIALISIETGFTLGKYNVAESIIMGFTSFEFDVFFIFFILLTDGIIIFLLGFLSKNPFGQVGATRSLLQVLCFKIPLGFSFIVPMLIAGQTGDQSFNIAYITKNVYPGLRANPLLAIGLIISFGVAILVVLAELEKQPFDSPITKTDIADGWLVEYGGWRYALIYITELIRACFRAGFIVSFFLGGPYLIATGIIVVDFILNLIVFSLKLLFVVALLAYLRAVLSNVRIDQTANFAWKYVVPVSSLALFITLVLLVI